MKGVSSVLARDEVRDDAGRLILGNPKRGCKHCGDIAIKVSEDDKLVLYHPGVECCVAAIDDQLRFRQGELDNLQRQIDAKDEALEHLREESRMYDRDSKSTEATKAYYRAEVAEKNYNTSLSDIKVKIRELSGEMSGLRLRRKTLAENVIRDRPR